VKRRNSAGAAGAPSSLQQAELAFNEADSTLYIGVGTGGAGGSATTIQAIAGSGTFATKSYVTSAISSLGGVSSVALSLPNVFTVSGSPVTTTGTLSATLATQTANYVWAGPTTGSAASPTFRALVAGDIPTLTAAKISDFATTAQGYRLDQFAAPTSSVSLNSQTITNLADPTNAQDAATKAYVDAARSGLDVKASVRVATTANITLSGTQTIDGVAVVAGDRVLVKNQATGSENGIYVVAAGSWSRATDADTSTEVTAGLFTFVEEGTAGADSGWVLSTNAPVTIGTTSLTFAQFSGAGQITAGAGLTKSGNTLDVATADSGRIVVNADSIDLATTGVSASTYKSVTVDTYGRVTAGTNPTTLSGYGITDALSTSSDIDGGSY
jgi:phage-related tail fiber protein